MFLNFWGFFFRFCKLKNPQSGWKPNAYILQIIKWSVSGAYIYVFGLAISSVVFHHGGFINNFYVCVKEEPHQYKTGLSLTASVVLGALLLSILFSVALDIFSLWRLWKIEAQRSFIRDHVQPVFHSVSIATINVDTNFPERKIIDEIPIRSSLINTLFLLCYLLMITSVGIIGRNFSKQENRALIGLPHHVMTIFRTWLVATLTFKKNDANRQRNANEERERLRQIEIREAIRKRRARREGMVAF